MNTLKSKAEKIIFYVFVFLLFQSYNFKDNRQSGWYQQYLPVNTGNLIDIDFTDSLTGYGITALKYVLKTTNGGDNWFVIRNDTANVEYKHICFLNNDTGYVGVATGSIPDIILKTTNGGNNWENINSPLLHSAMFVINIDTIWVTWDEGYFGGLYRTTNGGQSWEKLGPTNRISRIYFYNSRIGFILSWPGILYKTTNAGINWFEIPGGTFYELQFVDSLTGWKAHGDMYKTTNGGYNWFQQVLPGRNGMNEIIIVSDITKLSIINKDTLWGMGECEIVYDNKNRGILNFTSNGGSNWGYQVPDTSFGNHYYRYGEFINKSVGWAYTLFKGIHTTTGGNDTIIFTGINTTGTYFPEKFSLEQNYPNPFNQSSIINYKCLINGMITIAVYDITGKKIAVLVNEYKPAGIHSVNFNVSGLPSGIYFYSLIVDGKVMDTKKAILIK